MVEYRKDVYLLSYTKEPIQLMIPEGIYLYLFEIDSIQSVVGNLLDVTISDEHKILYSGPLDNDIKRLTFHNWISKNEGGSVITIKFTPNTHIKSKGNKWGVFNDCIRIVAIGYEIDTTVDIDENATYSRKFLEEWG